MNLSETLTLIALNLMENDMNEGDTEAIWLASKVCNASILQISRRIQGEIMHSYHNNSHRNASPWNSHDSRTYRDIMTASVAVNHAGMLGIILAHIIMKAEASRTYLILASLEPLSSGLVSSPVEQCAQLVVNQTIMTDFYTLI